MFAASVFKNASQTTAYTFKPLESQGVSFMRGIGLQPFTEWFVRPDLSFDITIWPVCAIVIVVLWQTVSPNELRQFRQNIHLTPIRLSIGAAHGGKSIAICE